MNIAAGRAAEVEAACLATGSAQTAMFINTQMPLMHAVQ